MNGEETKAIQETFRHELNLVFEPVRVTLGVVNETLTKHGEDIRENKVNVATVKADVATVSGRVWAVIFGVPTLIAIVVAAMSYAGK